MSSRVVVPPEETWNTMYPRAGRVVELPATSQVPWSLLITFEGMALAMASAAVQWLVAAAPPTTVPIPAVPRPMKVRPAAATLEPMIRATEPCRRTRPILMAAAS
jgi:hypothetical protein